MGAVVLAAKKYSATKLVAPRPYLAGSLQDTFQLYPDIGVLLPAIGYSDQQIVDLERTINDTECDAVIVGTPIDLTKLIHINKSAVRVIYELQEIGKPDLKDVLVQFARENAGVGEYEEKPGCRCSIGR